MIILILRAKVSSLKKGKGEIAYYPKRPEKVVNEGVTGDSVVPTQTETAASPALHCDGKTPDHSDTNWCTADGRNSSQNVAEGSPVNHQNPFAPFNDYCVECSWSCTFYPEEVTKNLLK